MLSRLSPVRVLLIGDFMLDAYTIGTIERISPEAPVPILHAKHEENRPGGAGNVALNLLSLGAHVFAVGRVGADEAGRALLTQLYEEGVEVDALLPDPQYKTPKKNRLIAAAQQIMRIDFEENTPCSEELEERLIASIESLLVEVDIIAISDYGKGLFVPSFLEKIISLGKERSLPVIVDPKGTDFTKYRNATLIKPNLKEAKLASGLPLTAPLADMAAKILRETSAEMLLVTKSNDGMSLYFPHGGAQDFPVRSREVKDVTGAGDTVLAALCVALANDFPSRPPSSSPTSLPASRSSGWVAPASPSPTSHPPPRGRYPEQSLRRRAPFRPPRGPPRQIFPPRRRRREDETLPSAISVTSTP